MTKSKQKKGVGKRKKSSGSSDNENSKKAPKPCSSPEGDLDLHNVSDILSQTNSILYDIGTPTKLNTVYPSVFSTPENSKKSEVMSVLTVNQPSGNN